MYEIYRELLHDPEKGELLASLPTPRDVIEWVRQNYLDAAFVLVRTGPRWGDYDIYRYIQETDEWLDIHW
jgi:hypothetical protein